jgi:hypothetical protein
MISLCRVKWKGTSFESNGVRNTRPAIGATSFSPTQECARRKAGLVGFLTGSDGAERHELHAAGDTVGDWTRHHAADSCTFSNKVHITLSFSYIVRRETGPLNP